MWMLNVPRGFPAKWRHVFFCCFVFVVGSMVPEHVLSMNNSGILGDLFPGDVGNVFQAGLSLERPWQPHLT